MQYARYYAKYLTHILSFNITLQGRNCQYPLFIEKAVRLRDIEILAQDQKASTS